MKTLESIQNELRDLVPQGTDLALAAFKKMLKPGSDCFNDYLALEGRYQDVGRQLLQGIISNENATLEFNKIRQALLDFISSLKEADLPELASSSTGEGGMADIYNGEVLYRIPKRMAVGVESECIVRLAFDRKLLLHDFEVQVGDVMKDLRIANVMGVELIDPNGDKAFEITTVYDTVQMVEKDLVTEWIFCVTPLKEGQYPLVLKISIIEIVDGVERKRNEVLKEKVEILLTLDQKDLATEFEKGFTWQLTDSNEQHAVAGGDRGIEQPSAPSPAAPQPAPAKSAKGVGFGLIGKVMAGVAVLLIGGVALKDYIFPNNFDVNPGEVASIERASKFKELRSDPNRKELEDFLIENPATPEASAAMAVLDSLENDTWNSALASNEYSGMQRYLDQYPAGKYADAAAMRMDEMNHGNIAAVDSTNNDIGGKGVPKVDANELAPNPNHPKPAKPGKQPIKKKPSVNPTPKPVNPTTNNPTTTPKPEKPAPVDPNKPVPLVSAARRPVFKKCGNSNQAKEEKCTEDKIYRYLKNGFNYPAEALRKSIEGTVVVSFVVERDGSITDVRALNDIGGGCAKEAVRLIKNLPKFQPGLNGLKEPIRVQYTQSVRFKLG
ncbi:MAG: TonB family protein [Saprospiraceae bacterium]|nr:TonB family protein [Saprospiraceae bacterium]MCF8248516.1 TonB family protein [Saprospiraceae bacterium]MCF8280587.1 TonB family protein [Bacteroidales bacterium]MCF8310250.1 TonB family protein [Saprospiraceae bacterium]MCF8439311.1 TonB family protein [Saprospiraceae bacterium]